MEGRSCFRDLFTAASTETKTIPSRSHVLESRGTPVFHVDSFRRYEERARGALQAMLEFNMRPQDQVVSMDELEQFWDSEVPRIGDAHPSEAGMTCWQAARVIREVSSEQVPPSVEGRMVRMASVNS